MDALVHTPQPHVPLPALLSPVEVTDFEFAYGARDPRALLPPPTRLAGLRSELRSWLDVSRACLDNGFDALTTMRIRPGVDSRSALRHIGALMNARLADADKLAAMAVLMHAWFDEVAMPDGPVATH